MKLNHLFYTVCILLTAISLNAAPVSFPESIQKVTYQSGAKNLDPNNNLLLTVTAIPNWEKIQANKKHIIYYYTADRLFMSNTKNILQQSVQEWLNMTDETRARSLAIPGILSQNLDYDYSRAAMQGMLSFSNTKAKGTLNGFLAQYKSYEKLSPNQPQNPLAVVLSQNLKSDDLSKYITIVGLKYAAAFPLAHRMVISDLQVSLHATPYTAVTTEGLNKFLFNSLLSPYATYLDYLNDSERAQVLANIEVLAAKDTKTNPTALLAQYSAAKLLADYVKVHEDSVNKADSHGIYPIHYAAILGSPETLNVILLKANTLSVDSEENNILHYAVLNPNPNILINLLYSIPQTSRIKLLTTANKAGKLPLELVAGEVAPSLTVAANYNILIDQMLLDGIKVDNKLKFKSGQFRRIFGNEMGLPYQPQNVTPKFPGQNNPNIPQKPDSRNNEEELKFRQNINDQQFLSLQNVPPELATQLKAGLQSNPEAFSPALTQKIKSLPSAQAPTQNPKN
jgi:hypothetical protein